MAVITVSREPGAQGEEIAARLAGRLGFLLVDKTRVDQLWKEVDLDLEKLVCVDEELPCEEEKMDPQTVANIKLVPDLIAQLAEDHDLVVIGRGGQGLFHGRPGTLHVRIVAPRAFRVQQIQIHEGVTLRQARRIIRDLEKERSRYLRFLYRLSWNDPNLYDLTLRMDRLSIEVALDLIAAAVREMKLLEVPRWEIVEDLLPEAPPRRSGGRFVNAAEREFARFLDFYHVPYEYEPRTFPLEVDERGKVLEAFTPDFYLPEQDLYIELTTMKQSLVTRKNRKVRKLRQLYPEINIRIFYQRDFYTLMAKYGLLDDRSEKIIGGPGIE